MSKNIFTKDKSHLEHLEQRRYIKPLVDIYETEEGLELVADLPGVSKQNLDVQLHDEQLTIVGHREDGEQGEALLQEFSGLSYRRTFSLHEKIDVEKIHAELDQGVLQIKLPKSPDLKIRQIPIQS